MESEFYDLCYEEWRSGGNPDNLSADDYDYQRSQGYQPDEISCRDIGGECGRTLW